MSPSVGVTNNRTANRQNVVQRVASVLSGTNSPVLREVKVHLGRSLGSGRHLEHDLNAIDGQFFAGDFDLDGRRDQSGFAGRVGLTETGADLAAGAFFKDSAVPRKDDGGERTII
jgi:hypothetical protein